MAKNKIKPKIKSKIKRICYVCLKPIKQSQSFYVIGKNANGVELYRHRRCNPWRVTKENLKKIQNWKNDENIH